MTQDVYAKITARIVSALREGVVPWHQPWTAGQGRPRNLISGKPYRGVNVWLLSGHGGSPFWLTYRQAVQIGGYVNKGAKGTPVIFWKFMARKGGERDGQEDGEPDRKERGGYALARAYTVFNATQCALPATWAERAQVVVPDMAPVHTIAACEKVVAEMPNRPAITHGGSAAFYRQSADQVTMPEPGQFLAPSNSLSWAYCSGLWSSLSRAGGRQKPAWCRTPRRRAGARQWPGGRMHGGLPRAPGRPRRASVNGMVCSACVSRSAQTLCSRNSQRLVSAALHGP